MQNVTFGDYWRVINVVATTTAQTLQALINTALTIPDPDLALPDGEIIQVSLTPGADVLISDGHLGNETTFLGGVTRVIPARNVERDILLKAGAGTITVAVELLFIEK